MRGLRRGESGLGERESRGVFVSLVQWDPSVAGRARELRAERDDGLVDDGTVEFDAGGWERADECVLGEVRMRREDGGEGKVRERRRAGVAGAGEVRRGRW